MAVELRHLRYFVALSEERHFDRAATTLGISQPALSQQIRRLEDELGVVLFVRSPSGLKLTPAGEALLPEAGATLQGAAQAVAAAQRAARGETGQLRVGFIGSSAHRLLPGALRDFRRARPEVDVRLAEVPIRDQTRPLYEDRVDVMFMRLPFDDHNVRTEAVLVDRMAAVLPFDHPLAGRQEVDLAELRDEAWVWFDASISVACHEDFVGRFRRRGLAPRIVAEAWTYETLLALVLSHVGVSLVPASTRALHHDGLIAIPVADEHVAFALVWREERRTAVLDGFLELTRGRAAHLSTAPDFAAPRNGHPGRHPPAARSTG